MNPLWPRSKTKSKKVMMIAGGSKGIGEACFKHFQNQYQIVRVSRTGPSEELGDLGEPQFIEHLIQKYQIDVLINSAGVLDEDYLTSMKTNFWGPAVLATEFYKKMEAGHIINITSEAAWKVGWEGMDLDRAFYQVAKNSLKKLTTTLEESRLKKIKVTSLEPGWVNTSFAGETIRTENEIHQMKERGECPPLSPEYLAQVIDWILSQPSWVNIHSLCLRNFSPLS